MLRSEHCHAAEPSQLDLERLTLVDTLDGLDAGTFTSALLVRAFLKRISVYEPVYNAFTFLNKKALAEVRHQCPKTTLKVES